MKYVDAVATVSSSLMSQAMLYRKPVIQIGNKENEIELPNLMDFVSSDNLEYKLADNYDVDKYLINKIFYRTHMRNKISKEHILNNSENPIYDYYEWNKIVSKF
ncbi:MAG: hypothetical protein IE880_06555 [Epsilonproteobacteria bacterium]|nr:hypothetical protein [Campylobacterota bacterium]